MARPRQAPPLRYVARMRTIGRRLPAFSARPGAAGLRQAAQHPAIGQALAGIASTGIAQGVYRFRRHEEADRQRFEALVRVVAANARRLRPGR
jgi:hypothetical protein